MNRESSIRTRRAAARARERKKRKLMITGGLGAVLLFIIILGIFVFVSCGTYDADTSTIYILENGKVVSVSVEAFDEKIYDKDELENYIKETLDTYNSENAENSVKQNSFQVEDGMAKLVMEYSNTDVFRDFEGIELFHGTIAEAKEAGYAFEGQFANVTDGVISECSAEEFISDSEYKVVIIKASTTICVEDGRIYYVSTENVDSVAGSYVTIKDGSRLSITLEDTQQGEAVETTEGSDGAVGEDELEIGTESTEIQFDFGDEEPEEGSQYSDVYTYIIYK